MKDYYDKLKRYKRTIKEHCEGVEAIEDEIAAEAAAAAAVTEEVQHDSTCKL